MNVYQRMRSGLVLLAACVVALLLVLHVERVESSSLFPSPENFMGQSGEQFSASSSSTLADESTTVTVKGVVQDSLEQTPIEGATVQVTAVVSAATMLAAETTTDSDGSFTLDLDVGQKTAISIAVSKETYAPYTKQQTVSVPPAQTITLETIQLQPLVTQFVGKLIDDESGEPIADMECGLFFAEETFTYIIPEPEWPEMFEVKTDATGTYTVEIPPVVYRHIDEPVKDCCTETHLYAGTPYRLSFFFGPANSRGVSQWHDGGQPYYDAAEELVFEPGSNTLTSRFITAKPFMGVYLHDEQGNAVEDTFFMMRVYDPQGGRVTPWMNAETNSTGYFTSPVAVAPGDYRLWAKNIGRGPRDSDVANDYNDVYYGNTDDFAESDIFPMPDGEATASIQLVQSGILAGEVTDDTGSPQAGERLGLRFYQPDGTHFEDLDEYVTLDDEGAFAVTPRRSGQMKVRFSIGREDEDDYMEIWSGNAQSVEEAATLTIPTDNERLELSAEVVLQPVASEPEGLSFYLPIIWRGDYNPYPQP